VAGLVPAAQQHSSPDNVISWEPFFCIFVFSTKSETLVDSVFALLVFPFWLPPIQPGFPGMTTFVVGRRRGVMEQKGERSAIDLIRSSVSVASVPPPH